MSTGTLGTDGPLRVPETPGEPAFDAHHPPSSELASDCVHCGFCLPTCPTYVLWGEEMDSPRGRIYLMQAGLDGEPMSDAMVQHFDACLGCMACVTACPSGVQYDKLIEATRAQVERRHRRPLADRLLREAVFALFPHPKRLRLMRGPLSAYQRSGLQRAVERSGVLERLSPSLSAMASLAPPVRRAPRIPEHVAARGERRAVVGMLTGCVQGEFFPRVNAATARVLAMEGCDVVVPREPGLLRRAVGAQRPRGGGDGVRAPHHRHLRRGRRRARRGQRGGLRLVDEGVRRAAGRRPVLRRAGEALRGERARRQRAARRAGPRRRPAPAAGHRGLPRRLPPRTRAGGPRTAARAVARHPRARAPGDRRPGDLLRVGRHLQHPQPGSRPASSAT